MSSIKYLKYCKKVKTLVITTQTSDHCDCIFFTVALLYDVGNVNHVKVTFFNLTLMQYGGQDGGVGVPVDLPLLVLALQGLEASLSVVGLEFPGNIPTHLLPLQQLD